MHIPTQVSFSLRFYLGLLQVSFHILSFVNPGVADQETLQSTCNVSPRIRSHTSASKACMFHVCLQIPHSALESTMSVSLPYTSMPSFCKPLPSKTLLPLLKRKLLYIPFGQREATQDENYHCKCNTFIK